MIRIKIFNGLGNQLFQYATARALQEKYGGELYLDIADFKTNNRKYGLNHYELNKNVKILKKDLSFFNLRKNILLKIFCKIMPKSTFKFFSKFGKYLYLGEEYLEIKRSFSNNYYLYGYWQSEKYFEVIKPTLKKELILKEKLKEKHKRLIAEMQETNSVAVYFRRGDYVNNKHYKNICTEEYYKKAIEKIKESIEEPVFYIFSDEINWVKENINLDIECYYMDKDNKDYEDLTIMSYCKHYIIANSSFSWWAQYLCDNKNKIVIAPKKWINDNNKVDIFMKEWITI